MIRRYIEAAMEHAKYEILQEDGTYYGEIKECPGVYSNAPTLEKCRSELEEVLEEWILFRVYKNLEIPPVDNIKIKIKKQADGFQPPLISMIDRTSDRKVELRLSVL
jgi:predicted RNase H-like HicB family nuclease